MFKKFVLICITLSLACCMSFKSNSLSVHAIEDEKWSDEKNRDTTWKDGAISNAKQLAQFAYLINEGTYSGENNVWLESNINLDGKEWTPIGYLDNGNNYEGVFNGNGYTVSGMSISDFTKDYAEVGLYGLFGLISGTIKNVIVSGDIECSIHSQYYYIGGIAGYSYKGNIISCTNNVNISLTDSKSATSANASSIGGIVGANYGDISNCINTGDIYLLKGNTCYIGGITGTNVGDIDRCENHGNIESYTTYVGGIAGYAFLNKKYQENSIISNCYNDGNIIDIKGSKYLFYGGIAGSASNNIIENCYNALSDVKLDVTWGNLVGSYRGKELNNSYYLDNGKYGLGKVESGYIVDDPTKDLGTKLTDNEMKKQQFVDDLNQGKNIFSFNKGNYPTLLPAAQTITVNITPKDTNVVIKQNDIEITPENDGTYLLIPGQYTLTAKAADYEDHTQTINVTLNQNTHIININLTILPADYTLVDKAIAKIPSDLSIYSKDTVDVLNKALNAVDRDKNIKEQSIVDSYAKAIEDAINGLKLDTTSLNNIIKDAEKLLNDAKVGNNPGQYPQNAIDKLKDAISIAKKALTDSNSKKELDNAELDLKQAIKTFNNSVITKSNDNTIKTDDDTNIWSLITVLLSAAAIALLQKRKLNS